MQIPFSFSALRSLPIPSLSVPSPKVLLSRAIAAAVTYALTQPAARAVILDTLIGSDLIPTTNDMERVCEDMLEDHVRNTSVAADEVDGLDRYITREMENFDFADNIKDAIDYDAIAEELVNNHKAALAAELADGVLEHVLEEIRERMKV